jgi:CheY-like chemotaxis protein
MRSGPVDLVLLDIMMPELDGYGVLEEVRSDVAPRDIPVVMISALEDINRSPFALRSRRRPQSRSLRFRRRYSAPVPAPIEPDRDGTRVVPMRGVCRRYGRGGNDVEVLGSSPPRRGAVQRIGGMHRQRRCGWLSAIIRGIASWGPMPFRWPIPARRTVARSAVAVKAIAVPW